ncbi:MAG: S8 family peptidase [Candidatus Harrisonbacteria bacterium]|nr:S8 family peptidase [Candidatus Harrisonbacteria bacterium]
MITITFNRALSILLLAGILVTVGGIFLTNKAIGEEGGRKIVVWQTGLNEAAKDQLLAKHGGVKLKNLSLVNGSAVWLPNKASEKALGRGTGVLRVEEDILMSAQGKPSSSATTQPPQTLPWGIDRVDAELVWPSGNNADPVKVAIVDTGISATHPDLTANIKGGYNAINPTKSWNDDNGHGSHVAGTVAALNNSIGVVGVGPAIDLLAVKVLNRQGSGFLSDVIEGIQWAMNNNAQVINLSLGSDSGTQTMHDAVAAAHNAGVVVVAAAGNNGGAVIYPAAYPEVIAVSATDSNNLLASFSSRGPEVDLAAPGVGVLSTYKGTGYATMSGTSMATPHVTGAAALVLNTPVGTYDANGNGLWDPSEVQQKLQDRATDLGDAGFDNLYGWGLVNAYSAVQP